MFGLLCISDILSLILICTCICVESVSCIVISLSTVFTYMLYSLYDGIILCLTADQCRESSVSLFTSDCDGRYVCMYYIRAQHFVIQNSCPHNI